MNHIGKVYRSTRYTFANNVKYMNIRNFGSRNIWDIHAVGLLHDDFESIQQFKNFQFHGSFEITEIPPPFCPKCDQYVTNKCLFLPIHSSIINYILAENPNLIISCPVFGEVSTIFDNDVLDETSSKKDE